MAQFQGAGGTGAGGGLDGAALPGRLLAGCCTLLAFDAHTPMLDPTPHPRAVTAQLKPSLCAQSVRDLELPIIVITSFSVVCC